jgi:hypothetical protein
LASSSPAIPGALFQPRADGLSGALSTRWGRALVPSLTDFFLIAVFVWLFMAGANGWSVLLADGDTGWHIRTGEWILAHGRVPTEDLFSFSKPDAPWFAWEWLSDVLFAGLFQAAGFKAIVLTSGVLIVAFSGVILRMALWRGSNPLAAGLAVLLTMGAANLHFLARPHLFTLLFLPISIWLLEADRRHPSRRVWLLIPLTALWTNLHGGWVVLIACLCLLVAGSGVESWLGVREWGSVIRYSALTAACSAVTLLNPYGTQLHQHILDYLRSDWIRNHVQEFMAPAFRNEGELQFELLLVAGILLCGWLLRRRDVTACLWILFLGHSALTSLRHAPLYVSVAAPLVAAEVSVLWSQWARGKGKASFAVILDQLGKDLLPSFGRMTIWPVLLLGILAVLPRVSWPADFSDQIFPVEMVKQQQKILASGRLLTTDQWGDYLIFHFAPKLKVFIDGRSDFYGSEFGDDYFRLMQGAWNWGEILRKYRFDVALLPLNWPLGSLLKQDQEWQLISDDGKALLFVRKAALSASKAQPGFVWRTKENPTER